MKLPKMTAKKKKTPKLKREKSTIKVGDFHTSDRTVEKEQ
jgi:hypothetical protein